MIEFTLCKLVKKDFKINSLNLCSDLKNIIYSFNYNFLGYSIDDINMINYERKNKKGHVLRVLAELIYFKNTGTSICWLRGCKKNGIVIVRYGAYSSLNFELNRLKEINESKLITDKIYKKILNNININ